MAARLFLLALGVAVVCSGLDASVCWSCDRRKSTRVLQKPCLLFHRTALATPARRLSIWLSQSFEVTQTSIVKIIEQVIERGEIAVLVTRVTGSQNVGAKLLIHQNGETFGDLGETFGDLGDAELDSAAVARAVSFLSSREETRLFDFSSFETSLLFERLQPAPRLVVCGAGH